MVYLDRVKESSTTTGTGNITLAGTEVGFRTFASATGVGSVVTYCMTGGSEWEVGIGTLTSGTTLTRTTVTASSNGNALVNFSAGTKSVFCTVSASNVQYGLTDPSDVGFDIILCAGQSNMEGNPTSDPLIDIGDPGQVYQWADYPTDSATYRQIITGVDPLYMPSGIRTGKTGLATWAAKAYLGTIPRNRKVLLVPVAVGSTGLVGSFWAVGGTYYTRSITETNLAITAALAMYPNSRFVGTFWAQGEADGLNGTTQAQYAAGLKAVIAGFRANITGAANSWFIINAMTPEGITAHTGEVVIDLAHTQVAAEVNKCVKTSPISGMAADVHWTAAGVRIMGTRMGLATVAAKTAVGVDVTAPTSASAVVANASPTTITVNASEALNTSFVPATSAFTVAGHTVSAVAVQGLTYTLTVDAFVNGEAARTVVYTQPGVNGLRDAAGNLMASFSGLAITNNVLAVDAQAPSFSSAQVANATPTVIQITMDETLAAVIPANSTFTASGGKSVTGVSIAGTVVSVTVNSAYVNGDTITITYTNPGSGNRLQDAAGNFTATFGPSTVTNNVGAAATAPAQMSAPVATAGDTTASVAFTAPANGGSTITGYTITSSPGGLVGTGSASPIVVSGLSNGTAYTFTATATNGVGTSTASPASNSVTPVVAGVSYTTLNAADKGTGVTLSGGDLIATMTSGFKSVRAIKSNTVGKKYYEFKWTAGTACLSGLGRVEALLTNFPGSNANSWGYYNTGALYVSNAAAQTVATYAVNDVIGVAIDLDTATLQYYKNGVAQGTPIVLRDNTSGVWIAGTPVFPMVGGNGSTVQANFGATAWAFAPPAGYTGWTV